MEVNTNTKTTNSASGLLRRVVKDTTGARVSGAVYILFFIHFAFLIMRFQDFPGAGWLGSIRFPGLISAIMVVVGINAFLKYPGSKKIFFVRVLIPFLVFEAFRGVLGFFIFEDWVLNDAWQFNAWLVLLIYLISFMLPISVIMDNGKGLRLIVSSLVFIGIILGAYSITHSGFGPGGHIGDENDNCLFLVSLLPFPFLYMSYKKGWGLSRFIGLSSFFLILLGIVRTNSRGGFLGLVAVVLVFFLVSKRKIVWLSSGVLLFLIALPFVPEEYWGEIKSIQTDSSSNTGTMRERLDTWAIVVRMWQDPRNTLFGVGLENTKWNSYLYEPDGAGYLTKSLAGRATHSLYFQILGDLGVWGVLIYGALIFHSLRSLRRLYKLSKGLESRLLNTKIGKINSVGIKGSEQGQRSDLEIRDLNRTRQHLLAELRFVNGAAPAIFSAWFGILFAALGISVAYYPSFWMYCALTTAFSLYGTRLKNYCMEYEKVALGIGNGSPDLP